MRKPTPGQSDVVVYSGGIIWNGCGQVYWPEHALLHKQGSAWVISMQTPVESTLLTGNSTFVIMPSPAPLEMPTDALGGISAGIYVVIGIVVVIVFVTVAGVVAYVRGPEGLGSSMQWLDKAYYELTTRGSGVKTEL